MYIPSPVVDKESWQKVEECIHHDVCTTGKVAIRLRNVYYITCASEGKLVKGCGIYISSRVHPMESCYKVPECIYRHVCITRKVVVKLRNVYITTCASHGKLLYGCGVYISSLVHHK